ncbi:ATP-binding protein [Rubrivirga sp. IMCC43871]|uniref:ATP-binding protein n=1 Tax=Rubrivirga sp. IMCC43871 TaxID=3391575 RepID=UPI0039900ECB
MPLAPTSPSGDGSSAAADVRESPADRRVGWMWRAVGGLRSIRSAPPPAPAPEALPATLLDAVADPVVVVDAGDRVTAMNRAACALLGCETGAHVGQGFADTFLPASHRDAHRERLQPGTDPEASPVPLVRDDGTEAKAEITVRPVADDGALFGLTLRDLGAAQRAASHDERRRRTLRTIVDAIPDPVVAVDRAGRVVFRNRASLALGRDAGIGPASPGSPPDAGAQARWRDAQAVLRSGHQTEAEEPDGRGGTQRTTRIPVLDASGGVIGLVVISHDITERKAEEARLHVEKEAAEAAARANGEFLATTSHEIRTLMSGVTGMTALLLGTDLDEEQRDYVDTVRTSSNALLTVVNDILDLSKIEAGMLEVEHRPFDVRRVVKEAASMVAQQASAKGLDLTAEVGGSVPEQAQGDETRVRQVLVNLLSNAIKFTDAGSVQVRVSATEGIAELTFAIEDTGVGIPPDRLAAIFERYAQADASTARTHGGTGLGLAICHKLVEMMGGRMSAESETGRGSTFQFTIALSADADAVPVRTSLPPAASAEPVARPEPARQPQAAPTLAVPPPPASEEQTARPPSAVMSDDILPSARVLLVEDDPVMQKVTKLTLLRLGYRPDVVANGALAVDSARSGIYDVILMDVMMPIMDGLEATRRIRADDGAHATTPIVALTANAMKGDHQRCMAAGCDEYLTKPVDARLLAATIERAVRARATG